MQEDFSKMKGLEISEELMKEMKIESIEDYNRVFNDPSTIKKEKEKKKNNKIKEEKSKTQIKNELRKKEQIMNKKLKNERRTELLESLSNHFQKNGDKIENLVSMKALGKKRKKSFDSSEVRKEKVDKEANKEESEDESELSESNNEDEDLINKINQNSTE